MFGTRQLEDYASLAEAGVSDDSSMYVLLRLLGGAKKRKKKTYTKPKKQKHKHKKVKLAVLNFYKVSHMIMVKYNHTCHKAWVEKYFYGMTDPILTGTFYWVLKR